jgi:hypothetical protein
MDDEYRARRRLIPIAEIDRAVLLIERWGSAEDRAALSAAIRLAPDYHASREAIVAIAARVQRPGRNPDAA